MSAPSRECIDDPWRDVPDDGSGTTVTVALADGSERVATLLGGRLPPGIKIAFDREAADPAEWSLVASELTEYLYDEHGVLRATVFTSKDGSGRVLTRRVYEETPGPDGGLMFWRDVTYDGSGNLIEWSQWPPPW